VNCEACHGALALHADVMNGKTVAPEPASHADDPATMKPVLPDTATLCARCHTASAAKPKSFPQVEPASHSQGLECKTCHNPHSPAMDAGGAK